MGVIILLLCMVFVRLRNCVVLIVVLLRILIFCGVCWKFDLFDLVGKFVILLVDYLGDNLVCRVQDVRIDYEICD